MKKRKIAILIFSMLFSAAIFAGCGQETNSSSNPVSSQDQEQSASTSQNDSQVLSSQTSSQPVSSAPSVVSASSAPLVSSVPPASSSTPVRKTFTKALAAKYQSTLMQYIRNNAAYTLYDINKDNIPELIINCDNMPEYIVYTISGNQVVNCGDFASGIGMLYKYNGNGIVVQDGGNRMQYINRYSLVNGTLRETTLATTLEGEDAVYDDFESALTGCTPFNNNFYSVDDPSLLNQMTTS